MQRPNIYYINKAKIVVYPIKGVRSIEINTNIKCGCHYENSNQLGIFHFLEHMIFQGTKKFSSAEKLSYFAKDNGIYYNAFTHGDMVNFYLNVPDININQALKIFEEMIFNPLIPKEKIDNELKVVTQEYLSKWDKPESRFFKKIDENVFGKDHPYCHDPLGQIECLNKISVSDLQNIHQQYFQPQNMIINITGNIKNIHQLIEKLTKILSQHPNSYKSKIKYSPIKPSSKKTLVYHDKPEQDTIVLIWILEPNRKLNRLQKISISTFSNLFGKGIDSLLFKTFRLEYGLVYSIRSSISNHKKSTFFEISCQIDPKNSQKFLKIFKIKLKNILNKVNSEMFQQTIKYLNYQTLMNYDSVKDISDMITTESFLYKKIFLPEDYVNLSKKINSQQTINYLKEKLTIKNMYTFRMTQTKPEN